MSAATSTAFATAEPRPPESFVLSDLVALVTRRWRIVAGTALAVVAIAAIVVLLWPPKYSATAMIVLEGRKNNVSDYTAVLSDLPNDPASVQNQVQVLQSRDLAERVIARLGLASDPEFNHALDPGLLGSLSPHQGDAHEAVVDEFERHLNVGAVGLSTTVGVTFSSKDPAKAARIANTIADLYLAQLASQKFDAARQATDWLTDRIHRLAQQVQAAESNVQAYKAQHNLTDTATGAPLVDEQVSAVNAQLVQAKSDLAQKQATLSRIKSLAASGHAADVAQIVSSPLIVQLREQEATAIQNESQLAVKYGPKNPKLIAAQNQRRDLEQKIQTEVQRLAGAAANDVAVAQAQVGSLSQSLHAAEQRATDDNMARVKLAALQSYASSTRTEYEAFVSRLRQIQDQDPLQQTDARVISHAATPTRPSAPRRMLIMGASVPAGLLLGLLIALLGERFGADFATRNTALASLRRFPIVAEVPRSIALQPANELLANPASPYALAMTRLAQRALFPAQGLRRRVVAVTGLASDETKCAVAVNLARAASRMGQRVVMVDGNLVSPLATQLMGLRPPARGMAEVIDGRAALGSALLRDPKSTAYVLSPAKRPAQPAEILSSPKMRDLFAHLRAGSDLVIVDVPSLSREAAILLRLCDSVLFVTPANAPASAVERALQAFAAMGAPALGVIIAHR